MHDRGNMDQFTELYNKPIRLRSVIAAIAVMALGFYACLTPNASWQNIAMGVFLVCIPGFLCLLRGLRTAYRLKLTAAGERLVAENDMHDQMSRINLDFVPIKKLRGDVIIKNL